MACGKISVIVPIYNVESYLSDCLESIIAQTYTDLEIILVDDGSPDRCGRICEEFAEKDERITVLHKENGGVSSARNAGIDIAGGEYIAFVDSDDTLRPDMYRTLYELIVSAGADLAVCNNTITTREGKRVQQDYKAFEGRVFSGREAVGLCFKRKISVTPWDKLYRRELFSKLRFPQKRVFEDYILAPELYRSRKTVVFTDRPLYNYIIRPGSTIWKTRREDNVELKRAERQARFERFNKYIDEYPEYGRALYLGVLDIIRDNVKTYLRNKERSGELRQLLRENLAFLKEKQYVISEKCSPTFTERFRTALLYKDSRICYWLFLVMNKIDILLGRT